MQKHAQRQFFRDIHKWIKDGCPKENTHHFSSTAGLCTNYNIWCFKHNKQPAQKPFHFEDSYPFNENSFHYQSEIKYTTIYQNAKRLEYIKKYL